MSPRRRQPAPQPPESHRAHHPPRGSTAGGVRQHQQPVLLKVLNPGEMFVVPKGLIHFQYNVGTKKARHHHLRQPARGGDRLHYPVRIDAGDSRRCAGQSFSGGSEGCHRHKVQVCELRYHIYVFDL
ncbi:unnamed protein product [Musa acuminata subsp. burmannicoides]